ncbi:MAG TPA: GNAT family protein [Rhodanobacteraceae bacterium]|nr:GNAT family protein [Rhodanobacteraceae bacterium]
MPETAPAPLPVIESARLRLRELRVEDADALFALFSDPEVMRYWSRGPWTERAEALEHIERMNHGRAEVEFYPWAIARLEDDGLVGTASLFEIAREHGRGMIGYAVAPAWQGRGYALEAVRSMLRFAFEVLGMQRIEIDTDPANTPSRRLAERCGARLEGLLRRRWFVHGAYADACLYGLLREEFDAG